MKTIFALLTVLLSVLASAEAEVVVYSGTAKELRPGRRQTSRAFMVAELYPFRLAIIVGGANARAPFIAPLGTAQMNDPNGLKLQHIYGSATTDLAEFRLNLLSNYTRNAETLWPPRRLSGHLIERKFLIIGIDPIENGGIPSAAQAPDFSDLALTFSLNARETESIRASNATFDATVEALRARVQDDR